ncbi:glycosyltransferase [bacterium]|nr:glycosyltransferase [bacterium]
MPSKIKPLSIENLSTSNRKRIIFFGRLAEQKNIPDLMLINDSLNLIDFYGQALTKEGIEYQKVLKEKGWYKGYIKNDAQLTSVLSSYKFSILYSTKKEGFSFSLVESLSQGIPIIVKDSFPSASYLCNNERGLLLPENSSIKEDIDKIIEFTKLSINKYEELQKNCIKFYLSNLSYQIFEEK